MQGKRALSETWIRECMVVLGEMWKGLRYLMTKSAWGRNVW